MDIAQVRRLIVARREKLKLTQDVVAKRAGVSQGVVSKIEDLNQPLTELRARVLFSVVEKGLGLTLSDFFLQIERQTYSDSTPSEGIGQTASTTLGGGDVGTSVSAAPDDSQRIQALFEDLSVTFGRLAGRINPPRRKTTKTRPHRSPRSRRA